MLQGEKGEAEAYCYHFREEGSLKNLRQVCGTLSLLKNRLACDGGVGLAGRRSRATTRNERVLWKMPLKRPRKFMRNRLARIKNCDFFFCLSLHIEASGRKFRLVAQHA